MAIGRLFYEMEQYQQAAEAYSKVDRDSPEFDTMLYELAWVYVRLGDVDRAERSLEVLAVADPDSEYIGDGTLLRADLLLRAGAFDRALQLYDGVRSQYEPMRAKVASFLDSTKDVSVYYERLAQQQLDLLDQNDQLPPLAVRWAREAEDGPLAFATIDDVNECKTLLRRSGQLVDRLNGSDGRADARARVSRARGGRADGARAHQPHFARPPVARARPRRRSAVGSRRRDRGGPPAAQGADGRHRGPARRPGRLRQARLQRQGVGQWNAPRSSSRSAPRRSITSRRPSTGFAAC